MVDDLRMRKFAPKTQTAYLRAVRQFARFPGRSADTATVEDLRNYQLHLVDHERETDRRSLFAEVSRRDSPDKGAARAGCEACNGECPVLRPPK
jgi:hypothetical protein